MPKPKFNPRLPNWGTQNNRLPPDLDEGFDEFEISDFLAELPSLPEVTSDWDEPL